ncbi:glycosyltransferase family 4 protein [Phreatobacter stygius]|uniref:Glycosyltransferase family 4 protein n=2 Tax=Phreatobacter stygius TaxID=1940610 RepID=A0A4D7B6A0_9HYPH|nr:glycosyltransferase family 4 protein [Phreatobacter stygius]
MLPHLLCVGGEDHALRIPFLGELRDRGFHVSAASSGDGTAFSSAGLAHRTYHFDRFDSRGADLAAIGQLARVIAEVKPDIVQSFDTKPNLLAPFAVRGAVPVVRTINGMGWVFSSNGLRARALRPAYCALQWGASHWTASTVFQNTEDKAYFERYRLLGNSRAHLIRSSGIDIDAFERVRARGPSPAALRQQLGLGDAPIVMTVSRLTREKGIPTLLEAVSLVRQVRPEARFLLVGPRQSEGPFAIDQAAIDRLAPQVVVLGARSDVPALLDMADLFVLPTEYREGIPRVLLEAGLAGLPIVATQMPGCNDVVTDAWNGYLVPPRDPRALAARILDLLHDRGGARAMGRRSVALVRREFRLGVVVEQYSDLYRQILGERFQPTQAEPSSRPALAGDGGAHRRPSGEPE